MTFTPEETKNLKIGAAILGVIVVFLIIKNNTNLLTATATVTAPAAPPVPAPAAQTLPTCNAALQEWYLTHPTTQDGLSAHSDQNNPKSLRFKK